MIIPARILNKYNSIEPYLEPLRKRVRESLLVLTEREGFALVSRIKALGSVSEKVESGRFASWEQIDDLVAFTIVVPKLKDEEQVLEFLKGTFDQVALRSRGSTLKAPDMFRFDSTRFIGRVAPLAQIDYESPSNLMDISFEVQIRSAFEHAWSVTTHALTYKSPDVSWSKLRLTAQLKAAVEQLDTLVAAFESATSSIEPSMWPEIDAKMEIKKFFASQVQLGRIPDELAPKDWSRFVDNVFSMVAAARRADKPQDISQLICRDFEAELKDLRDPSLVPRSISLWQLTFASLVKSGSIGPPLYRHWPLITPELEVLYPPMRGIATRFNYS